jgi:hypothetical protein
MRIPAAEILAFNGQSIQPGTDASRARGAVRALDTEVRLEIRRFSVESRILPIF